MVASLSDMDDTSNNSNDNLCLVTNVTELSNNNASDKNVDTQVALEETYKNLRETTKQLLEERSKMETLQKEKANVVKKQEQLEKENSKLKIQVEQLKEMQNQAMKLEKNAMKAQRKCTRLSKNKDKPIRSKVLTIIQRSKITKSNIIQGYIIRSRMFSIEEVTGIEVLN